MMPPDRRSYHWTQPERPQYLDPAVSGIIVGTKRDGHKIQSTRDLFAAAGINVPIASACPPIDECKFNCLTAAPHVIAALKNCQLPRNVDQFIRGVFGKGSRWVENGTGPTTIAQLATDVTMDSHGRAHYKLPAGATIPT